MFSRDNLFFGGIFVLMTAIFMVWGFNYLENNFTLFILAGCSVYRSFPVSSIQPVLAGAF
jgi:hypothetical protein